MTNIDSATTVRQTDTVAGASSPSKLSKNYVTFSTVAIVVTSTTPSYLSPSSTNNNPFDFSSDNSFHIIDHGSVLYLVLQILLYNQPYVYDHSNNDSVSSVTVTSAVTTVVVESLIAIITKDIILSKSHSTVCTRIFSTVNDKALLVVTMNSYGIVYKLNAVANAISNKLTPALMVESCDMTYDTTVPVITKIFFTDYNEDSSAGNDSHAAVTIITTAIIMMATVFYELPFAIDNDTVYFAAIDALC